MLLILINSILIIFSMFLLIILWCVWPPDSPWTPWWRTNSKKAIDAGLLAKINSKDVVYELGSGDSNFLVAVCKKFGCRGVGIEIDYIRTWQAKINVVKNGLSKKIKLERGNFYEFNLNTATVVFCYLVPRVLEKLKPQLLNQLKKGTKIISYKYRFKETPKIRLEGLDKKNEIYLYKIV